MGSIRMSVARARLGHPVFQNPKLYARGDPGFFSFLGGLAKTVSKVAGFVPGVGSVISAGADELGNLFGGGGGGASSRGGAVAPKVARTGGRGGPSFSMGGRPATPISIAKLSRGNVTQAGFAGADNGTQATDPVSGLPVPRGGRSGPVTGANIRGHHLNRSSYTLKDGTHVEKGTKLVTNRRRNPGNPRALHRAVSRMVSFEHMSSRVNKQLAKVARKAVHHRGSSGMRGHRPGCGCVGCKRR